MALRCGQGVPGVRRDGGKMEERISGREPVLVREAVLVDAAEQGG